MFFFEFKQISRRTIIINIIRMPILFIIILPLNSGILEIFLKNELFLLSKIKNINFIILT